MVSTLRKYNFNYFYISLIILWSVIQHYIGVDGKGRVPFFVTVVFLIYSIVNKGRKLFSKPLGIWLIWVVFALLNTFFIQGSAMNPENRMAFFTNIISGPLIAYCIGVEYANNRYLCLKYLGYILLTFTIGAISVPSQNVDEGHAISAFGNLVPISIVFLTFVFSLRYIFKDITFKFFGLITLLSVTLIVASATRKAFGGVAIVLFFTYLCQMKRLSVKTFAFTLLIAVGLYMMLGVLESTDLFERFITAKEKSYNSDYADSWFLTMMDDRAIMYVGGWVVFLDNMWLGIGLYNFVNKGYSVYTLHTEYMVQLAECGLVGTTLFLAFYIQIVKGIFKAIKNKVPEALAYFGGFLTILFMSFTAWTYNQPVFFIGIGLILSFISSNNKQYYYK